MPLVNVKQYINLVLGYAYYGNVTAHNSVPTLWVHTDSIVPPGQKAGKKSTPPVNVQPRHNAYCRECDAPAHLHPVKDQFLSCNRQPETIGQDSPDYGINYREDYDHNGFPFRRYEGMGVNADGDQWDAIDYVSPELEESALDRWKDNDPEAYTHALDYWYVTPTVIKHGTYTEAAKQRTPQDYKSEPDTRNAYVEGFDGFIALRLIDEYLTSKHHEHTLNVFRDKQGNLRVGGIVLSVTVDGMVEAKCVNGSCSGRDVVNPNDVTRERMEEFVYGIIAHGNNHAARWFTSRNTYYKLHANDCNIGNCDMTLPYCPSKSGKVSVPLTDEEVVAFLMDHNDKCRDAKCKCDEVLIDLVPALAHI